MGESIDRFTFSFFLPSVGVVCVFGRVHRWIKIRSNETDLWMFVERILYMEERRKKEKNISADLTRTCAHVVYTISFVVNVS